MKNELVELKDELKECKTGQEFFNYCKEHGLNNSVHIGYMAGVADSLFWAGKISQEYYTMIYNYLGV